MTSLQRGIQYGVYKKKERIMVEKKNLRESKEGKKNSRMNQKLKTDSHRTLWNRKNQQGQVCSEDHESEC